MILEGFEFLKKELGLVSIPVSTGIYTDLNTVINHDLNLRSRLEYDSIKDLATTFYTSATDHFVGRPTATFSFLIVSNPDTVENSVCNGIKNQNYIQIPNKDFNLSINKINLVDYSNNSSVFGNGLEVDKSLSTPEKLFLKNFDVNTITANYLKIIDSSGVYVAILANETQNREIYSNYSHKTITEYADVL